MKLVILDRDGVINIDSDNYIRSVDQWVPIPNSINAIADLSKAGYLIAIATNQSGIGREYYSLETLKAMHDKMEKLVSEAGGVIHHIAFCPHLPTENCQCRKPKPGMLIEILKELTPTTTKCNDESHIWFIGDSLKDIEAGKAAGIKSGLVRTGKGVLTLADPRLPKTTPVFEDLADFSQQLLSGSLRE